MKGFFLTMDAAAALLITLVFVSMTVSMLAASDQSSEDAVYMTRLARDAYEANRTGSIPSWINTSCSSASEKFNITALEYNSSANNVTVKSVMVCS